MSQASDGMSYDPQGRSKPVVEPGEFPFAVAHLDHLHINGMTGALQKAGGDLRYVFDTDAERVKTWQAEFSASKNC